MTRDSFGKPAPTAVGIMAGIPRRTNIIEMPTRKTSWGIVLVALGAIAFAVGLHLD